MRGLILTPAGIAGASSFQGGPVTKPAVMKGLLYWDKLVLPTFNMIKFGAWEEDFLTQEGIMSVWNAPRPLKFPKDRLLGGLNFKSPQVSASISNQLNRLEETANVMHVGAPDLLRPLEKCYEVKSKNTSENWMIDFSTTGLQLDVETNVFRGQPQQVFGLELRECLPIPRGDVPLEDLLHFRDQRSDDFNRLALLIENFYQNWVNSADPEHQLSLTQKEIRQAIDDVHKVAKESPISFGLTSWRFEFSPNILATPLVREFIASGNLWEAAIAGGITLTTGRKQAPPHINDIRPYQVLADLENMKSF